jgi:hypothetical protein
MQQEDLKEQSYKEKNKKKCFCNYNTWLNISSEVLHTLFAMGLGIRSWERFI